MVSAQEIRVVAELLQISPEGLQKAITYKVTVRIKVGKPCYPLSICLAGCLAGWQAGWLPTYTISFSLQETMREKIYTPLTVESAVDAR